MDLLDESKKAELKQHIEERKAGDIPHVIFNFLRDCGLPTQTIVITITRDGFDKDGKYTFRPQTYLGNMPLAAIEACFRLGEGVTKATIECTLLDTFTIPVLLDRDAGLTQSCAHIGTKAKLKVGSIGGPWVEPDRDPVGPPREPQTSSGSIEVSGGVGDGKKP
ncbi:MAG TPA: hypothetical protein VEY88_20820 [Archangium sp.]|nr:hypothetical protein [Archangium sp.]